MHRHHSRQHVLFLLVSVLLGAVLTGAGQTHPQLAVYPTTCGSTLQALVDAAAANSTLHVPDCLYREDVSINKPLTLIADSGAEIRGADVWSNWQQNGAMWTSTLTVPTFNIYHDTSICASGQAVPCIWPEQVWRDGVRVTRVVSNPGSGQFALDGGRHVIIGDAPAGHTIEVTTRQQWISGFADHVTIQGFRMRYAADDAQIGALDPGNHSDWTIEDCTLSDAHGQIVTAATRTQILRNNIFNAGNLGIGSEAGTGYVTKDDLIQGNAIHDNATDGFDPGWGAGGVKFGATIGATFDNNRVYNNNDFGLWCDISCANTTFTNNRIYNNSHGGLLYEISDGAHISNNQLWHNGWGAPQWGWGAGIILSNSSHSEVANNVLAWNADGISIISSNRVNGTGDDPRWNTVAGDTVHDNIIAFSGMEPSGYADPHEQVYGLAWLQTFAGTLFAASAGNAGTHNGFWYPDSENWNRFAWIDDLPHIADFQRTPGGNGSYYLNQAQISQILAQALVPSSPTAPIPNAPPAATATPLSPTPMPTSTIIATMTTSALAPTGGSITAGSTAPARVSPVATPTSDSSHVALLFGSIGSILVIVGTVGFVLWRRRTTTLPLGNEPWDGYGDEYPADDEDDRPYPNDAYGTKQQQRDHAWYGDSE